MSTNKIALITEPDETFQKLMDVSRLRHMACRRQIGLRKGLAATYSWPKSTGNSKSYTGESGFQKLGER